MKWNLSARAFHLLVLNYSITTTNFAVSRNAPKKKGSDRSGRVAQEKGSTGKDDGEYTDESGEERDRNDNNTDKKDRRYHKITTKTGDRCKGRLSAANIPYNTFKTYSIAISTDRLAHV
jgi:hypothetical protein